jgi:polysaccharide export outer membrane protein
LQKFPFQGSKIPMFRIFGNLGLRLLIPLIASLMAIACLNGCGASAQSRVTAPASASGLDSGGTNAAAFEQDQRTSSQRLEAISEMRAQQRLSPNFSVGPGDVLEVSVPNMEELKSRQARVSANNTIELPVVGTINVEGMDEGAIGDKLRDRLKEYMRDPQVDVFVKHYQSREVAVAGMVQKPGLYTVISRSDTILDMIGRAGGMTEGASTHIIFIPAPAAGGKPPPSPQVLAVDSHSSEFHQTQTVNVGRGAGAVKPVSAETPAAGAAEVPMQSGQSPDHIAQTIRARPDYSSDAILIDFSSIKTNMQLDVPVLPGDAIIVPAAGEVMVHGWVATPGAFRITPGMTVLGAVTAAGGEMFSSSAEILRTAENGHQIEIPVNLSRVQHGAEPDPPVQSGDVVVVNRSALGAVPYLGYSIFSKFATGAYLPIPAF